MLEENKANTELQPKDKRKLQVDNPPDPAEISVNLKKEILQASIIDQPDNDLEDPLQRMQHPNKLQHPSSMILDSFGDV